MAEPFTDADREAADELERRARYGAYVAARTEADRRGHPMPDDRTIHAAIRAYRAGWLPGHDARVRADAIAPRLVRQAQLESELADLRRAHKELQAVHDECVRGELLEVDEDQAARDARVRADERAQVAEEIEAIVDGRPGEPTAGTDEFLAGVLHAAELIRAHATPPTTEEPT